jgi:membrane-bound serine protease (ClpP class)
MLLVWCLLVAGLILIVAEIFLPGLVVGTLGAICLLGSVVLCYSKTNGLVGTLYLAGVIVSSVGVVGLGLRYFPRTSYGRKMVLDAHSRDADELSWLQTLQGKKGIAHTMLRPAGTALIEGKRVDVVTEGGMIPKGSSIEVIAVEGSRVVVRKGN